MSKSRLNSNESGKDQKWKKSSKTAESTKTKSAALSLILSADDLMLVKWLASPTSWLLVRCSVHPLV
jgi:hypothetical protein